jgi:hypothetical protein
MGTNKGLTELGAGDTAAAAEACGDAWPGTSGMDVDTGVTNSVGTRAVG